MASQSPTENGQLVSGSTNISDKDAIKSPADAQNPTDDPNVNNQVTESGDKTRENAAPGSDGTVPNVELPGLIQANQGAKTLESSSHLKAADNLPSLSPNVAALGRIPPAPKNIVGNHRTMPNRSTDQIRHPNQMPLVKMSTVTMAARQRAPSSRMYYNNYVETRKPRKTITWDEATNARPPLRIDMDGPGPCSYSPRNKPLYETNAPSWSFGRKTFVEKELFIIEYRYESDIKQSALFFMNLLMDAGFNIVKDPLDMSKLGDTGCELGELEAREHLGKKLGFKRKISGHRKPTFIVIERNVYIFKAHSDSTSSVAISGQLTTTDVSHRKCHVIFLIRDVHIKNTVIKQGNWPEGSKVRRFRVFSGRRIPLKKKNSQAFATRKGAYVV
ncbi:hypothetical protein LSH36_398g02011 [Paralvinella palmiformis]|uniref:Uncharacterized protein n=1 Tax=Paralvinella palmiformis TaxID=53620 RepID=A0AAD9N069_9ANNE|nr:hypothetical protein LSH36_398g02011 [Paralvinella palmiformis]